MRLTCPMTPPTGETCSTIALCYWSQRMFALTRTAATSTLSSGRCTTASLSGVACYDGETFFNATRSSVSRYFAYALLGSMSAPTHHRRVDWFDVSCCPPDLVRMVASRLVVTSTRRHPIDLTCPTSTTRTPRG
ncbi:MAG: glycoside hydrolase family 127 protein [Chloroflexi bacterium]|nr:glycoside hydrolase family 127 protein [Chloroflexota bacterium]